jgi:hypothetical protein
MLHPSTQTWRVISFLRQRVELIDRPGPFVIHQTGKFEPIIAGRQLRHVLYGEIRVVAEVAHDIAFGIGRSERLATEQKRLRPVVPPRHQIKNVLHRILVGDVASGQ